MCLITNNITPSIATEDIICYKRLDLVNGCFRTPFLHKKVCNKKNIIGYKQAIGCFEKLTRKKYFEYTSYKGDLYSLSKGFIHTYSTFGKILKNSVTFDICGRMTTKSHMFKCIIPKGSKYWVGQDLDLCSDKIIYKKEIDINSLSKSEQAVFNHLRKTQMQI